MDMTTKKVLYVGAIALALTFAAGAQAKDSRTIVLRHDANLGATALASGKYSVQWEMHSPQATVTFVQRNKVVATAEGKVVDRGKKAENDEVLYDMTDQGTRIIREIRFRASSEVIELNP
jgi:hypothetical protein